MPLLGAHAHAELLAAQPQGRVARQKHEPGGIPAGFGQAVAVVLLEQQPQKPVGQLHHDAGAVAGLGISAGGAAMLEPAQRGLGALEQLVAGAAVEPGEGSQAARGVFEPGIPQWGHWAGWR